MNYIHRLAAERDEARAQLTAVEAEISDLLTYLASDKFAWPDGDFIHIRTDLGPRLLQLRNMARPDWQPCITLDLQEAA